MKETDQSWKDKFEEIILIALKMPVEFKKGKETFSSRKLKVEHSSTNTVEISGS